jgi:hypothetical protein
MVHDSEDKFRKRLVTSMARWFDEMVQARATKAVEADPFIALEACAAILEAHLKAKHFEDRLMFLEEVVTDVLGRLRVSAPDTFASEYATQN